jgi:ferric-dicitrate binding protein FerR (iron transport regulator)
MPYKDPERKRQWEREHREQRSASRRAVRLSTRSGQPQIPSRAPGPILTQEPEDDWKAAAGIGAFALAVLISLFAGWVGLSRRSANL